MGIDNVSPMLEQYRRIKREHQGEVLFFRLGDFYEMFESDALEISALLNLTLTSRSGKPMCGIPYHAAKTYIARLLKLGKKIAVCEQLSQPGKGRQVIDRQVVEIITPGTTVEEDYLDKGSSNYLASLSRYANFFSFAYIDLSAGDFYAASFSPEEAEEKLRQELQRLQIKEMLVQESLLEENSGIARALNMRSSLVLNRWADWLFDLDKSKKRLEKQFGVASLKGFGLGDHSPEILSAGALLDYLDDTAKSLIPHVRTISIYSDSEYVGIDEASQRNLELVRNLQDGDTRFSLLEVMDETRCAMGRRLLKRRILHPLRNLERITARLDLVEALYRDQGSLSCMREILGKTPDLQRLCARLAMDKAHGKDMLAIKNALNAAGELTALCGNRGLRFETPGGGCGVDMLLELRDLLERGIADDPSILLTEGNLIRGGYNAELDQLHALKDSGRQMLEDYLEEEKRVSGISSLKIRYNRLIGYFFEVNKNNLTRVPSHFIRRQGMAGGERYSTERLAALESDINGASEKIVETEKKLFLEIREQAKTYLDNIASTARWIAEIDTAQSLAKAASVRGWVRPVLDNSGCLAIYEGRHPVVEAHLGRGEFIPNDITLDSGLDNAEDAAPPVSFALITGPNMAGKSTYLRSAALITLMAQMGSFVPAREARVGLCDRIYCRVGASDNLARGESTFLVEMNETAYILNTATDRSLVIMDEVGRGTGTNDGLSIAWAVSEELLNRIKCRTLFATHYHELSLISHPRMANRSMEVLDQGGEVIFLRKLREGPAGESYGIHVAGLAGLSETTLERAGRIMDKLRERDLSLRQTLSPQAEPDSVQEKTREEDSTRRNTSPQNKHIQAMCRELSALDINAITPLDALSLLSKWQKKIGKAENLSPPEIKPPQIKPEKDSTPSLFE